MLIRIELVSGRACFCRPCSFDTISDLYTYMHDEPNGQILVLMAESKLEASVSIRNIAMAERIREVD